MIGVLGLGNRRSRFNFGEVGKWRSQSFFLMRSQKTLKEVFRSVKRDFSRDNF